MPFYLLVLLLSAVSAFAQGVGTTSSLSGTVTTEGKPLPGVTVTIKSPALQGTRTAITGDGGGYNFPSLPPGTYTINFSLEGMQPVTTRTTLQLAESSHKDVDMHVSTVSEAITVTAAAPAVLETTEVARNFSQKEVQELPVRRNVRDTVLLAPGVTANGPNNQLMLSGGPSYDNLFLVNGVVVNENLRGQPHNLFIEDAIQETTIFTGSISAEYGRFTGGVVSTLTKSGGNQFSGSLRDSLTNPKWVSKTVFPTEAAHPNKNSSTYEGTLGGYVLKDRIWFFGAGRHAFGSPQNGFNALVAGVAVPPFGGIQFLNTLDENRYEGKLTGNLTQKHTIVGSYLNVKTTENNNFFAPIYDTASIVTQRELPNSLKALAYNGILTSNILIEGQASQKKFAFVNSGGIYTDRIRGTWISDSNARFNAPVFCGVCTPEERNNDSWNAKGHYYLNTKKTGNHDLLIGAEMYKETRLVNNNQSASNFTVGSIGTATFLTGDPTPYPHFAPSSGSTCGPSGNCGTIIYRPILLNSTGDHLNTQSVFANDKWDFNSHWNFNAGLRYDKNHAVDATGNLVSDDHNISPRLGLIWDVKGDGRSRVNVSAARYVSKITDGNAGGAGNAAGSPAAFQWAYQGAPINPVDSKNNIIGTPQSPQQALATLFAWLDSHCDSKGQCGINATDFLSSSYPGYTTRVLSPIKSPNVNELTAGFGHLFSNNAFAKVDFIKRDWHDFYALKITKDTGQITAPNGTVNDLAVLVNDDSTIKRTYRAAQLTFGWSPRNWSVGGGYTFSKLRGNDGTEADGTATSPSTPYHIYYPEFLDYANRQPVGYLLGDVTHRARVWTGYTFNTKVGNFIVSGIQSADSGRPYSAIGTIAIFPQLPGTNGGPPTAGGYVGAPLKPSYYTDSQLGSTNNYYFSTRGAFRTPSVFSTDLALNYELPVVKNGTLFVQGQVINAFNNSKVNNLVSGQFDTTIRTSRTSGSRLAAFNPFTDTPIECPQADTAQQCFDMKANWQKGPSFGQGLSKDAYQTPRTYRVSVGVRF
ncbi:MAG TPA: carboxypeptidase regulatory-like domain-containing protein [Thermoanaerobaculia bacterium]|nr:carboxypeptidase regulatory-like domain-containing protein [Thermoanaerobaculia bacterium]